MTQASYIKRSEKEYESVVKETSSGAGFVPMPVSLKGKRVIVILLDD